jgi:hypothetical protein
MTPLVEKQLLVFLTNNEESTRESREYTGFTHKFSAKRYPLPTHHNVPTHDSDDDESDEIVDGTSLHSALLWIRLQASHSQACHIITKVASHTRASIQFSLLAVKYQVPPPPRTNAQRELDANKMYERDGKPSLVFFFLLS